MRHHPARLNQHKRDGGAWSDEEIDDIVRGVVDGSLGDGQLGALLMAVCCRGMSARETARLTLAMRDSGRVLELGGIPGRKVDKHSTGGVGDKVSLCLAPLVAACGVPVPMISGRGLGHTGGTIDKLAAIPGYRTDLEPDDFVAVLRDCGFAMAGASAAIAPADRRMYAMRDVSGTVESIPLITASILSKKLAEGIDGLVMDVKCGRAAFMKELEQARALAQSLVSVGTAAGVRVTALLTDMDRPLGRAIGNHLEVLEAVQVLKGQGPADLNELTLALGVEMLLLAGETDAARARARLTRAIADGSALECLRRNVVRQDGDPRFLDEPKALGSAPVHLGVASPSEGHVVDVDPLALGLCAMDLGAGRLQPSDRVDPLVGILMLVERGARVTRGQPLAMVFARTQAAAMAALERVLAAIRIGSEAPPERPLVLARIGA
ncbi:MAG: thymidine phosphorylase [Planctomycetes bacterium]|nr:thymidine phosphorylase [Planctomycetota bacterium]